MITQEYLAYVDVRYAVFTGQMHVCPVPVLNVEPIELRLLSPKAN